MKTRRTFGGSVTEDGTQARSPGLPAQFRRGRAEGGRPTRTFAAATVGRPPSSGEEREPGDPGTSPVHKILEVAGIAAFAGLAVLIGREVYLGFGSFGYLWLLPALGVVAYLTADLLSGVVHFFLDNFGSAKTPVFGPYFVKPFREHHSDPLGITRHDFIDTNGNNSLASVPVMLVVWLAVPMATTVWGCLFGAFFLMLCLGVFLTNQFHKWAHVDDPPAWVARLQRWGLVLSKKHHDVHHESPYDTYYCITVGVWNPLFDKIDLFERTERLIRRHVPGTDPLLRSEREGSLNG